MTEFELISCCRPAWIPLVYGVLKPGSMLIGTPLAGKTPPPTVRLPKGSYENRPGTEFTAELAASANCCGVKPVSDCTFCTFTAAFAGMGAWPGAVTVFR